MLDPTVQSPGPVHATSEMPDRGGGATKLNGPQVVASELFIYTLIGCSCFTVSIIKVGLNKIN